jgi:hypothetical protein
MALLTPMMMGFAGPAAVGTTIFHATRKLYADGPVPWPKKPSPTPIAPRISQEFIG